MELSKNTLIVKISFCGVVLGELISLAHSLGMDKGTLFHGSVGKYGIKPFGVSEVVRQVRHALKTHGITVALESSRAVGTRLAEFAQGALDAQINPVLNPPQRLRKVSAQVFDILNPHRQPH